ncbi:MAG: lytic transglycosylase domain-containing protein, partial [Ignavibacteria bacterium]|nr:lytic transglycosylase domain-containing protein [Ignavibacteria bacterium]
AKSLKKPSNSIKAGTSYIAEQFPITNFDPPKVACAYNSGGVYQNRGKKNRWKMRQYPIGTAKHCDRFVNWFNDAVFVLKSHPKKAKVPYKVYFT